MSPSFIISGFNDSIDKLRSFYALVVFDVSLTTSRRKR